MTVTMHAGDIREFVRTADDGGYVAVSMEPTPRQHVVDLYGPLARAQAMAPVHPVKQSDLLEIGDYRTMANFANADWACALGFDAATEALTDPRFSSRIWADTIGQVWGPTIIGMDGDEHRLMRSLASFGFVRRAVETWAETLIQPVLDGLIDRFVERGSADLATEFTLLFPVYVITEMLGLPPEDTARFHTTAAETIAVFYDRERGMAAAQRLYDYLLPLVQERRADPGDDLLSRLATAEVEGERLDDLHVISFIRLLLNAGGETTYRSSGNLLLALLNDPAQLVAVRADRTLVSAAIEEGVRWEPPLTSISRYVEEDCEFYGVPLRRGSILEVGLGIANRDPSRWERPHEFDLHREKQPSVAFAWGPHACLGTHLAKLETGRAINTLLDRLPNLRLDEQAPRPMIRGIGFRSPDALPVVWG